MLDLNDPVQFTIDGVRKLIASKDDSQNRQLRVSKDGKAFISEQVGGDDIEDLAFRFETWIRGNGYSGTAAANDDKWVSRVYDALKKNWPNPTDTFIDDF
jgi:hypothetical protein